MKKIFLLMVTSMCLIISTFAQQSINDGTVQNFSPPTTPGGLSQFEVQGKLLSYNSLSSPASTTQYTGSFDPAAQWSSLGRIDGGSQTLYGQRYQRAGRGLVIGFTGALQTTATPTLPTSTFIQWIGNSASSITPGNLDFKFALNPTGSSSGATPITIFTMEPNSAGTGGNSYATNGLLGHKDAGTTFGSFTPGNNWSGIGKVIPASGVTLYGGRYQFDASSLITSIRQDVGNGTKIALIEFGNDEANPGSLSIDELRVRYFSNPNVAASAVDFVKFIKSSRSSVFGYSTVNPLTLEARVAVYDGVAAFPYSMPGTPGSIESAAVYGVSSGTDQANIPRKYSAGVVGDVYNSSSFSGSYGILGIGPRSQPGFAGYFIGDVFATGIFTSSDAKLKKQIVKEESALDKLMQLRPSQYLFDTDKYKTMNLSKGLQHGFIAQELETVFPEMITTVNAPSPVDPKTKKVIDPFSFKAVNYQQLHGVEVAAIQELKNEIEALKTQLTAKANEVTVVTDAADAKVKANSFMLAQNVPNPFTASTTIKYNIPEKNTAMIALMDLNGKMLLQFNNLKGTSQITINGNTLQAGMYLYTLVVNGQEILTKKMILTK